MSKIQMGHLISCDNNHELNLFQGEKNEVCKGENMHTGVVLVCAYYTHFDA